MGIYLYHDIGSEEGVLHHELKDWARWRRSPKDRDEAEVDIGPGKLTVTEGWLGNELGVVSVAFKASVTTRALSTIAILITLGLLQIIAVNSIPLVRSIGFYRLSPLWIVIAATVIAIFAMLLFISPVIIFGYINFIVDEVEELIIDEMKKEGIEIRPFTSSRHWVLFPGDLVAIQLIYAVIAVLQLQQWIGGIGLVIILIAAIMLLMPVVLGEFVYARLTTSFDVYSYWKARATELTYASDHFFWPLPLGYFALSIIINTTVSLDTAMQSSRDGRIVQALGSAFSFEHYWTVITNHAANVGQTGADLVSRFGRYPIIDITTALVGLVLVVVSGLVFKSSRQVIRSWQDDWQRYPHHAPAIVLDNARTITNWLVISRWLQSLLMKVVGVAVVAFVSLWIVSEVGHIAIEERFIPALVPFYFFQMAFFRLLGSAGEVVARLIMVLACLPIIAWLILCVGEALGSLKELAVSLLRRPDESSQRVMAALATLSAAGQTAPPHVKIEAATATGPEAAVIFPVMMGTVIRISDSFLKEVDDDQLRLMLAHELAHTRMHRIPMWLTESASRLALLGPGFLALTLDYRRMELEADRFAIDVTGNAEQFASTIDALPMISMRATIRLAKHERANRRDRVKKRPWHPRIGLTNPFKEVCELSFGGSFWGAVHPTTEERIANVMRHGGVRQHTQRGARTDGERRLPDDRREAPVASSSDRPAEVRAKRIVVAHGDSTVRAALVQRLTEAGYEVRPAGHLVLVDRALAEDSPDVLLFDLFLPGRVGLGVVEQVRARADRVAMFVTAPDSMIGLATQALRSGARGYIPSADLVTDSTTAVARWFEHLAHPRGGRFDAFTAGALAVLRLAAAEAQWLDHDGVGPEHLLLGLAGAGDGVAKRVLDELDVRLAPMRAALEAIAGQAADRATGEFGLTPQGKRVIEGAVTEAERLRHQHIGSEHLLLAVLRVERSLAVGLLESMGVRSERVRARVLRSVAVDDMVVARSSG